MKTALRRLGGHPALTGTALLFASMTLVNGGNYLFNLLLGRWLGPAAFADLSLMVTIMLMVTFITVTFQLTSARYAAIFAVDPSAGTQLALYRWLSRYGRRLGAVAGLGLAAGAIGWQRLFHTDSAWPFVLLGIALPIYFVQGVGRGVLQGESRFGRLASSYQVEMIVRLGLGLGLVALGFGVNGAVLAISLSFVASWLLVRRPRARIDHALSRRQQLAIARYAWPVVIVHLGQILINNSDILLVKRFFAPIEAGHYAAVALVGRIVFFATWSVVTVLFPLVAQREAAGRGHRDLIYLGLGAVTTVTLLILFIVHRFPEPVVLALFGPDYRPIAPLLWRYALATGLYALANVFVTYHLSLGRQLGSWLTVLAGLAQVLVLALLHADLTQVINSQIILMAALLAALLAWDSALTVRFSSRLPFRQGVQQPVP